MPSLISDVGSATANAFVDESYATDYLDNRLNSGAWTAAEIDDRERALIEATLELSLLEWTGTRTDSTQALAWPRSYAVDVDLPAVWEVVDPAPYFADDVIPERVKKATVELALEFLRAGTTDLASTDKTVGIKRKRVDVLETEYESPGHRPTGLARFPRVMALIAPLLSTTSSGGIELIRV